MKRAGESQSQRGVKRIRDHGPRLLKFGFVGLIGVGVNMLAYTLLHEAAGAADFLARTLAIEISVLHNFTWNFFWTWSDRGRGLKALPSRLLRYHGSTFIASFVIPLAVGWLLDRALGEFPYTNYISHLTGVGTGMLVNYAISDLWVFRTRKTATERNSDQDSAPD